ncbi:MAG: phosphoserine phosphatase SerB [Deltaproteobacteria bacterium]|nr:phosphoserine phosphatase SerB [Deltaproteobacteria bacterium]
MQPKRRVVRRAAADIVLVTVQGPDGPGITAALTEVIAKFPSARLLDIEQTVVHRKLLLSLLLGFDGAVEHGAVLKELLFAAQGLGVQLSFDVFDPRWMQPAVDYQYAVTCLGAEVGAVPLSRIARALAARRVNIDKIGKLTVQNLSCVELLVHADRALDHRQLSRELLGLATALEIDIAVQPADWLRRAKRLIALDMDSTLIQTEVIDELGREAGVERKMQAITTRAMQGRVPFREALAERVRLLRGVRVAALDRVYRRIRLMPGAERLIRVLKHLGFRTALISGGFTYFTERLQHRLGFDYAFANTLELRNGALTGRVLGEIVDGERKALLLTTIAQGEGIALDQVVALGDGANDLPMLARAGLGIAFHAHERVRRQAAHGISARHGLDTILYLLGISDKDLAGLKI